jgi:hypothetical protein
LFTKLRKQSDKNSSAYALARDRKKVTKPSAAEPLFVLPSFAESEETVI